MINIHKNDHDVMMLIFQKKCGCRRGSENSNTCWHGGMGGAFMDGPSET